MLYIKLPGEITGIHFCMIVPFSDPDLNIRRTWKINPFSPPVNEMVCSVLLIRYESIQLN
jgi:hypothetical protein